MEYRLGHVNHIANPRRDFGNVVRILDHIFQVFLQDRLFIDIILYTNIVNILDHIGVRVVACESPVHLAKHIYITSGEHEPRFDPVIQLYEVDHAPNIALIQILDNINIRVCYLNPFFGTYRLNESVYIRPR